MADRNSDYYRNLMGTNTTTHGDLQNNLRSNARPVSIGNTQPQLQPIVPPPTVLPPPTRSFSDDQQYMRDTAKGMYGKGQPISRDMRDYYGQKWSDAGMNFNEAYPIPQEDGLVLGNANRQAQY